VVLDCETTGLEWAGADRVIEIACVALEGTQLTGEFWHSRLNPRVRIQPGAQAVHGIKDEDLEHEPEFSEVFEDLIDFLGNDELVGHNLLGFDRHFLNKELKLVGKPPLDNRMIDTLLLARNVRPGKRNSLDALCKDFGIRNTREGVHGALVDADLNARVYAHLAQTAGTMTIDFSPSQEDAPEVLCEGQIVVKATDEELDLHAAMCKELGITSWQRPQKAAAPHPQVVK
jgi:DNA polymerase-3 subunit epsilon